MFLTCYEWLSIRSKLWYTELSMKILASKGKMTTRGGQNTNSKMVRFCFKSSVVAFRGQTHFSPEIFKITYLRTYATKCVDFFHHLWQPPPFMENAKRIMESKKISWSKSMFKLGFLTTP